MKLSSCPNLAPLLESYSRSFIKESLIPSEYCDLWASLELFGERERIPSISLEVGALLSFLCNLIRPKVIFEFGSGVGHSAFWYFVNGHSFLDKLYLTEKREVLWSAYSSFSWPKEWKEKTQYYKGDAFELFPQIESPQLVFIDGQKGLYLPFFQMVEKKLDPRGVVVIDNVFWKGNVLDDETKKANGIKEMSFLSSKGINDFNQYIRNHPWKKTYLPIDDGVILLHPN